MFPSPLPALDRATARAANQLACRSPIGRRLVGWLAGWLSGTEVILMVLLGLLGHRRAAVRALLSVALTYVAVETFGRIWQRSRPFDTDASVTPLVHHQPERSFPSRHVASAFAMAEAAHPSQPKVVRAMSTVAWLLAIARVAAGVHYPSDALAGIVLGRVIGRLARRA